MSATDLANDSDHVPVPATSDDGRSLEAAASAALMTTSEPRSELASSLAYSPDDFVDDDSWAKPRPRENKRLVGIAAAMGVLVIGLGAFTLGAKLGKDSTKTSTGSRSGLAAAFGGGGFGGLGGGAGAGGFGGGRAGRAGGAGTAAGATGTGAAGTSQAEILAGLLAGDGTGTGAAATAAPAVQGTVTKVDATSITITKADGSTVVITIDNKAEIARRAKAALADVKVGERVGVTGTTDSVGNVAAAIVTVGDLEPVTETAAASGAGTTTDTTPTPNTSNDLGGLLGG